MEICGFEARKLARELPLYAIEWKTDAPAGPPVEHVNVFEFNDLLAMKNTPNVRLITHGAQAVREGDRIDPKHAWVWGFAKVMNIEQPQLNWSCVDLGPSVPIADQLALLQSAPNENQLALRDGRAYVPRLVRTTIPDARMTFRDDCAYVITGASGALGQHVARWMLENGAKHLILVSRSQWDAPAGARVVNADVSDRDELDKVFDSKIPIKGIIHAAGVIEDALLHDLTWDRFQRVFAPKIAGTWNLHERSLALDLNFFVCFSSAASLIGSRGQANYAAANAFMDALIHHRRALGLPGLSINWSAWAEGGMAAKAAGHMTSMGIDLIDPRSGLDTLGRLMRSTAAQIGVIPADWSKLLPAMFDEPPPFYSNFVAAKMEQRERIVPLLEKTPREARRQRLESHIRELVVSVMGRNGFTSGDDDPSFFELGMDSLMSLDLRNRLQTELDRTLPSTVALEYPAVRDLVDYLIADVLPAEMFA